jgi:ankyrin repeat protein
VPFRRLLDGDCAALKRHIKKGGEINAVGADFPRITLLHAACGLQLSTAAHQLVEGGADLNATTDDGITPLMSVQTADLARLLLDNGADIEQTTSKGWNVLRRACITGNVELAKLLLKRLSPASIMQAAPDGMTPLYSAISFRSMRP